MDFLPTIHPVGRYIHTRVHVCTCIQLFFSSFFTGSFFFVLDDILKGREKDFRKRNSWRALKGLILSNERERDPTAAMMKFAVTSHSLALKPWASHLSSLSPSFLKNLKLDDKPTCGAVERID